MITLENVSKSYTNDGMPALNNVSLHIDKGEFVFIVGDSGSGKSTMIKLLLRELTPTSGRIIVNNFDLSKLRRRKIPKYRRNTYTLLFQYLKPLEYRDYIWHSLLASRVQSTTLKKS